MAPVLLWNPAILLLKNITKSIINHANTYFLSSSTPTYMYIRVYISIINTKCFNALTGIQASIILYKTVPKSNSYHSGREVTIRDVVIRDIKTTTVSQMRDVHIRDKIIKDCILLGLPLTVGM